MSRFANLEITPVACLRIQCVTYRILSKGLRDGAYQVSNLAVKFIQGLPTFALSSKGHEGKNISYLHGQKSATGHFL